MGMRPCQHVQDDVAWSLYVLDLAFWAYAFLLVTWDAWRREAPCEPVWLIQQQGPPLTINTSVISMEVETHLLVKENGHHLTGPCQPCWPMILEGGSVIVMMSRSCGD